MGNASWHSTPPRLTYHVLCFRALSDLFLTLFNTQKDFFLVKLEHSEMSCPFVKKVTCITILKRIEKKRNRIFQSHVLIS